MKLLAFSLLILLGACSGGGAPADMPPPVAQDPLPDPGPPRLAYLAGNLHGTGDLDASGPFARFNDITSTLMDGQDRLWITDGDLVRRIDAQGSVETLSAHEGTTAEGRLADVRFQRPFGLTADPAGNIWLLDAAGIRKIDTAGRVTTVPVKVNGQLVSLFDAAAGVERQPRIAVDAKGTIYVMEYDRVRRMLAGGELLPFAGARVADPGSGYLDAQGTAARFVNLQAIVVDGAGNLFLNDASAGTMRRVDAQGNVTTFAGKLINNVPAVGIEAQFVGLYSNILGDADGNLYVFSYLAGNATRAHKITPDGVVSPVATFMGTPVSFARSAAGNFFFNFRDAVTQITPAVSLNMLPFSGVTYLSRNDGPWVPPGADPSARMILAPTAIAADKAGNIYVVDTSALTGGPGNGAMDDTGLMLFKISPAGAVTNLALQGSTPVLVKTRRFWFGRADAETYQRPIARASGIAIDKAGNFYISEQQALLTSSDGTATPYGGGSIVRITPDGEFSVVAGKFGATGAMKDGKGAEARFNAPVVLGFDKDDNLYVRDYMAMRKISPAGDVSTITTAEADLPLLNKPATANGTPLYADGGRRAIVAGSGANAVVVAGGSARFGIQPGSLPGAIDYPHHLVTLGPRSFAFISGGAVMKLVLP